MPTDLADGYTAVQQVDHLYADVREGDEDAGVLAPHDPVVAVVVDVQRAQQYLPGHGFPSHVGQSERARSGPSR